MHSLPRQIVCRGFGGKGGTAFQPPFAAPHDGGPGRLATDKGKSTWIGRPAMDLPLHHVAARG